MQAWRSEAQTLLQQYCEGLTATLAAHKKFRDNFHTYLTEQEIEELDQWGVAMIDAWTGVIALKETF